MIRRNCCQVIDQIKAKVPEERKFFLKDLDEVRKDAAYKAPEETIQWERLHRCLLSEIFPPNEEWEIEIWSIFSTVPVERIKEDLKKAKQEE